MDAAVAWLNDHDLVADKHAEEGGYLRFIQSDEKTNDKEPITAGMPEGILLICGKPQASRAGLKAVDGDIIKGKTLSSFLGVAMPDDDHRRRFVMRKIANEAEIPLSTVHMLVLGKLNCPTMKMLEVFSNCLDISLPRLVSAAKRDGCVYED